MPSKRTDSLQPARYLMGDGPHGAPTGEGAGDVAGLLGVERARLERKVNPDEQEIARIEARLLAIGDWAMG